MNAYDCIHTLQAAIRHKERTRDQERICLSADGHEICRGTINLDRDELYQAMKFAVLFMKTAMSKENGDEVI